MEKDEKSKKSLTDKLIIASAVILGAIAINNGSKTSQIKEITSTYQGYTTDDVETYLVFDDKTREQREGFPTLVIEGNPDTLKIGERYTLKYEIKNWDNFFSNKIKSIQYSK
jgi:protein-disulfide isomerase-like protein with CxxC motif